MKKANVGCIAIFLGAVVLTQMMSAIDSAIGVIVYPIALVVIIGGLQIIRKMLKDSWRYRFPFIEIILGFFLIFWIIGALFMGGAVMFFIALDKLFYLGFDVPVVVVWAFWGFVIGAAIQGCREMKVYGRKWIGILIAISPMLLLVLVGAAKVKTDPFTGIKAHTAQLPSGSSGPEGMVLIPANKLRWGGDPRSPDIHIGAFYMDRYEVTNAEYVVFLNESGKDIDTERVWVKLEGSEEAITDHLKFLNGVERALYNLVFFKLEYPEPRIEHVNGVYHVKRGYENHPVSNVSWYGAMAYATWAQKRLPTAVEWLHAARGGLVGKRYRWIDRFNVTRSNLANEVGDTTPVGSYAPNGYGLYDMWGNVSELSLDRGLSTGSIVSRSQLDYHLSFDNKISNVVSNFPSADADYDGVLLGGNWRDPLPDLSEYGVRAHRYTANRPSGFRCVKAVSAADRD